MRKFYWLAGVGLIFSACLWFSLPSKNICFQTDIVPLLHRDCAYCHEFGEYGVKLKGNIKDLPELLRYVVPNRPEQSPLLAWADGKDEHPVLWAKTDPEYKTVAAWIKEGATDFCFDREKHGECKEPKHCDDITCFCSVDNSIHSGRYCSVDDKERGTCGNADNCTEPGFVHCDSIDAGFDAYSEVSFSSDLVPMLMTDCRSCHRSCNWTNDCGQRCCTLIGTAADYPEVMDFVDVDDPEAVHGFLWWAAGGGCGYIHPVSWPKTGWQYQLFLQWVQEGARNN